MMGQPDAAAQTAATNAFNALASTVTGVSTVSPTFNIADGNNGLTVTRTVTVSYTANVTNNFSNVLKLLTGTSQTSWPISGSSQSTSNVPPNINFYLLLGNSPSMKSSNSDFRRWPYARSSAVLGERTAGLPVFPSLSARRT